MSQPPVGDARPSQRPGPDLRALALAGLLLIGFGVGVGALAFGGGADNPPQVDTAEADLAAPEQPDGPALDRFDAATVTTWVGDDTPLLDDAFVGLSFLTALEPDGDVADAVTLCQSAAVAAEIGPDVPVLVFDIDGQLVASGGGYLGTCAATSPSDTPLEAPTGQ